MSTNASIHLAKFSVLRISIIGREYPDGYTLSIFILQRKHWGCKGPLIIDARLKPHHAPPLTEDPKVTARVDELRKKGGPLHGII